MKREDMGMDILPPTRPTRNPRIKKFSLACRNPRNPVSIKRARLLEHSGGNPWLSRHRPSPASPLVEADARAPPCPLPPNRPGGVQTRFGVTIRPYCPRYPRSHRNGDDLASSSGLSISDTTLPSEAAAGLQPRARGVHARPRLRRRVTAECGQTTQAH